MPHHATARVPDSDSAAGSGTERTPSEKGDQSVLPTHRDRPGSRRRRRREGFTLVEVLVALAVVSVATWIILSLFSSSLKLERSARSTRVATDLARDRMADILARPAAYAWPEADAVTAETGAPLKLLNEPPQAGAFALPAVLPASPLAQSSEKVFYERFSWEAFVKRPAEGRGFYEVLVVVRWTEANRPQQVVLTGSIPVAMTKEAS